MGLKTSMKGSGFVFNSIDGMYGKCHRVSLNRGGSCLDSPDWIKNRKAAINTKNNDKYFQYAVTAALNHYNLKNDPERISKIKPTVNNYNWKELSFHHM